MHTATSLMDQDSHCRAVLAARIREKIADYERYGFSSLQSCALNVFFDLAQEYEDIVFLYHLPVKVLRLFFGMDAELYVRGEGQTFIRRTASFTDDPEFPPLTTLLDGPMQAGGYWYFPACGRFGGKAPEKDALPPESPLAYLDERKILSVLVLHPEQPLTEHERLYYEEFANRLGFCLHNRQLAEKNREHIRFVRGLVHDIGHNVIAPNLYFKLLIRQMAGKITALGGLCQDLADTPAPATIQALGHLHNRMVEQYQEITRHFQQSSFFLETLLRQSHFEQGQYVLQKTSLDLVRRVVGPQMERYLVRFQEKNIAALEEYPAEGSAPLRVLADMGLLSQVMANLFSNALKYTRETPGRPGLHMRCTVDRVLDFFGLGEDGARVCVCTSGAEIPEGETGKLFMENFRASNTEQEYGTGHGLHFTQIIMEQHNGVVGYERLEEGNCFYVVLPCFPPGVEE